MDTVARGTYKVEFYRLLPTIRQMYESGDVVVKLVYENLLNAGKITMSYDRFAAYFRKEVSGKVGKTTLSTPKKETRSVDEKPVDTVQSSQALESKSETEHEPIWLTVGEKKKTGFNPHSRDIDPKDIL